MRRAMVAACVLMLGLAHCLAAASAAESLDLRRGVPDDAFLVVRTTHNPERDYQKGYYEEVWRTVEETRVVQRALQIATSRMGEEQLAQANHVWDELREATASIDVRALAECRELVYAQQLMMWQPNAQAPSIPNSQHLLLLRTTPEAAAGAAQGMKNLFALVEKYTDGKIPVIASNVGGTPLITLGLPPQSPVQPTVAHLEDVVMLGTSPELLEKSLGMMTGGAGPSKFDDPRLAAALQALPQSEDSLVFYDGRLQFAELSKIGSALAQVGAGDPNVDRAVQILDIVMKHISVLDYEVTVGYTEGNLNRSASYGKWIPGTEDMTLRKMLSSGQPFEKWQAWVPAGSLSYSLGTGVNLHVLYERLMTLLQDEVPEAADALTQFETMQEQIDLHVDRDILQAFSGEYALVSVVSENGKRESVMALRCQQPERIRELIQRGIGALQQIEWVKMQQLSLTPTPDLNGFENVSASMFPFLGLSPVIGFQDGWMFLGQSSAAVKKVLNARAGQGETIDTTEAFQRLNIDIEGAVQSIRYANTAENIRAAADALRKAGFAFQLVVTLAGANAEDKSLEPVKELLALLPDVAKIVEKFDFLEATMTVAQQGEDADSYTKRSVTVVRPAAQQ